MVLMILMCSFLQIAFFRDNLSEYALELLHKAANQGHDEALYALDLVSIFLGRHEGVTVIANMKDTMHPRQIRQCRLSLQGVMNPFWVLNHILMLEKPRCYDIQHHRPVQRNGWSDSSEDEYEYFNCRACSCDVEIANFYEHWPGFF